MKPRVEIKQRAQTGDDDPIAMYPRRRKSCRLIIDGAIFDSQQPFSEAEATEINIAAERLVEEMNKR